MVIVGLSHQFPSVPNTYSQRLLVTIPRHIWLRVASDDAAKLRLLFTEYVKVIEARHEFGFTGDRQFSTAFLLSQPVGYLQSEIASNG